MKESNAPKKIFEKVEEALKVIRPYLEADGGDVKVLKVDNEGMVFLELLGACGTCPMSIMTLKAGVEGAIKRAVPEVKGVEAVNLISPDDPNARMPDRYY